MSLRDQLIATEGRMNEICDEIEAVGLVADEAGRNMSQEESESLDKLRAEFEELEKVKASQKATLDALNRVQAVKPPSDILVPEAAGGNNKIPAQWRNQKSKYFEDNGDCYCFGRWLMGLAGDEPSKRYAIERGFEYRNDQSVGTPGLGGYTVPTPLAAEILRLVEAAGVIRGYSRNMPMSSMTLDVPRRTGGLTVEYPAEGTSWTPSDVTVDQVNLVAKKYATMTLFSTELAEDAIISWTDLITREIALAIATAEDTNGFLGDGSASFGGITGIASALQAGAKVTGGAGGWGGVDMSHINEMIGRTKLYAGFDPAWFMTKYAFHQVIRPLLQGLGGTDQPQVEAGGRLTLEGYPIVFTQVLPGQTAGAGDMGIVFGDLSMTTMLGVRRQLNIRLLSELYAASDQLALMSTSRSDFVCHDIGDATTAGGITALILAA